MNDKTLGAYERHESPDYADGGVAAALIEKEAENAGPSVDYHAMWWKAEREREKAERERDSWESIAQQTARSVEALRAECHDCVRDAAVIRESRPLTPDAITDEMVLRAINAHMWEEYRQGPRTDLSGFREATVQAFRTSLAAALTEPPARPEGAEDVAVALFQAGAAVGVEMTPEKREALADHLAAMGYRKDANR